MSNGGSQHNPAEPPVLSVVAHPAERRLRRPSVQAHVGGGCCCTCCCCLHSVGGLIGAAVASIKGGEPTPESFQQGAAELGRDRRTEGPSLHDPEAVKADTSFSDETPTRSLPAPDDTRDFALPVHGSSAVKLFWLSLLALIALGWPLLLAWNYGPYFTSSALLVFSGFILLLWLPGFQVGACLVTWLILAVSTRPDKRSQLRQLGKILLGVVIGTIVGLLLMFLLCGMMTNGRF